MPAPSRPSQTVKELSDAFKVTVPPTLTAPGRPGYWAADDTTLYVYTGNGRDFHSWITTAGRPQSITESTTAAFGESYEVFASATFTDPTPPQEGGYRVTIRNGTATIGGTAYTEGEWWRVWHSGSWATYRIGFTAPNATAARGAISSAGVNVSGNYIDSRAFRRFAEKLGLIRRATVAQARILTIGDSMAGVGIFALNSAALELATRLGSTYGLNGASLNPVIAASGSASTGVDMPALWPSSLIPYVETGGTITYSLSGGGAIADTLRCLYIAEPGAGSIKVEYRSDADPTWIEATASQSANAAKALGVLSYSVTAARYLIRVTGLSGRVYLLPAGAGQFSLSNRSGIEVLNCFKGGLSLVDMNNAGNAGIFASWLSLVSPDLILWEMKESASYLEVELNTLIARLKSGAPLADIALCQSTPVNSGNDDQIAQNAIIRKVGDEQEVTVIALYDLFRSYAYSVAAGWDADGIHRTQAGNRVCADFIFTLINSAVDYYNAAASRWELTSTTTSRSARFLGSGNRFDAGICAVFEVYAGHYVSGAGTSTLSKYLLTLRARFDNTYQAVLTHLGGDFSTLSGAFTTNTTTEFDYRLTISALPGIHFTVVPVATVTHADFAVRCSII